MPNCIEMFTCQAEGVDNSAVFLRAGSLLSAACLYFGWRIHQGFQSRESDGINPMHGPLKEHSGSFSSENVNIF